MKKRTSSPLAAVVLGGLAFIEPADAQITPKPVTDLYENLDIWGVLECRVQNDIRIIAGTTQFLRCDYVSRSAPDSLKRYAGYVRAVKEGASYRDNDYICWTVLFLHTDAGPAESESAMKGAYSIAPTPTAERYMLKDGALVGGSKKRFSLEPGCAAENRAGRNIADHVTSFELSGG